MKKTLITACLGLFAFGVMAQETAKPVGGSGPMIQVDKDVHVREPEFGVQGRFVVESGKAGVRRA